MPFVYTEQGISMLASVLHSDVEIFTYPNAKITNTDISNFNAQYPQITVKRTAVCHNSCQ